MSCGKRFYGTTIKPQSIFYSILLKAKLQPVKINDIHGNRRVTVWIRKKPGKEHIKKVFLQKS